MGHGISAGAKAGIAIGVIIAVAAGLVAGMYLWKLNKKRKIVKETIWLKRITPLGNPASTESFQRI
jgi:hypothetical protein